MSAATTPRNFDHLLNSAVPGYAQFPVAGGGAFYYGSLISINAAGNAIASTGASTERVVGAATESVDNSAGATADKTVSVLQGVMYFFNSGGGDAITKADVGNTCYCVDNQTVAKTSNSGARCVAGKVWDVRDDGQVGVKIDPTS